MRRILLTLAFALSVASASSIDVQYTLNMGPGGTNKTPLTALALFQTDGTQLDVKFIPDIAGVGTTVVNSTSPFTPTLAFLIGISEPAELTGRRHLIAFVSQYFADTYTNVRFMDVFAPYGELTFGPKLRTTFDDPNSDMEWLKTFYNTAGYKAAFAYGTTPIAGEFTAFNPLIPEPATYSLAGFAVLALIAAHRKK